jgi:hypothetical protein
MEDSSTEISRASGSSMSHPQTAIYISYTAGWPMSGSDHSLATRQFFRVADALETRRSRPARQFGALSPGVDIRRLSPKAQLRSTA